MKREELRKKKEEELEILLEQKRNQLRKLRFDLAERRLKNVNEIRNTKREIARILTILNEKKWQKKD